MKHVVAPNVKLNLVFTLKTNASLLLLQVLLSDQLSSYLSKILKSNTFCPHCQCTFDCVTALLFVKIEIIQLIPLVVIIGYMKLYEALRDLHITSNSVFFIKFILFKILL